MSDDCDHDWRLSHMLTAWPLTWVMHCETCHAETVMHDTEYQIFLMDRRKRTKLEAAK